MTAEETQACLRGREHAVESRGELAKVSHTKLGRRQARRQCVMVAVASRRLKERVDFGLVGGIPYM